MSHLAATKVSTLYTLIRFKQRFSLEIIQLWMFSGGSMRSIRTATSSTVFWLATSATIRKEKLCWPKTLKDLQSRSVFFKMVLFRCDEIKHSDWMFKVTWLLFLTKSVEHSYHALHFVFVLNGPSSASFCLFWSFQTKITILQQINV